MITASKENWDDRIVCYYINQAPYRQNEGRFVPEDLDPSLCTHMIYLQAQAVEFEDVWPTEWGIGPFEWKDPDIDLTMEAILNPEQFVTTDMDWAEGIYARFHNVTKAYPGLKVSTVSQ